MVGASVITGPSKFMCVRVFIPPRDHHRKYESLAWNVNLDYRQRHLNNIQENCSSFPPHTHVSFCCSLIISPSFSPDLWNDLRSESISELVEKFSHGVRSSHSSVCVKTEWSNVFLSVITPPQMLSTAQMCLQKRHNFLINTGRKLFDFYQFISVRSGFDSLWEIC